MVIGGDSRVNGGFTASFAPAARHWSLALGCDMKKLFLTVLCLASTAVVMGEDLQFSNAVQLSLIFRDVYDAKSFYPHTIQVYLRLDNVHDADVTWTANAIADIEAELLDAAGKPVPNPPQAASIQYSSRSFMLPYGSRLDWLISHGGVSMADDTKGKTALVVGSRGWLLPMNSLSKDSLRIKLRGVPWERKVEKKLLLDIPPTPLQLTK